MMRTLAKWRAVLIASYVGAGVLVFAIAVSILAGTVSIAIDRWNSFVDLNDARIELRIYDAPPVLTKTVGSGFGFGPLHTYGSQVPNGPDYFFLGMDLWLPILVALLSALLVGRKVTRISRCAEGFCRKCGYNMFGLVHTTCPECGHTAPRE